jgi:ferredoxin
MLALTRRPGLVLDEHRCSGHGRCYSIAPQLFDCDENGHGRVKSAAVGQSQLEAARAAEANCPERAVSLSRA